MSNIVLIVLGVAVTIMVFYVIYLFVIPRKVDDIAKMIQIGQTKAAIKKLSDMLEKNNRNYYAHFLLGEAYLKEGNAPYAINSYQKVLTISKFDHNVKEVDVRGKLADLFKSRKSLEEAKNEYLLLTKLDPANYKNYYELGQMYYEVNQFDKAVGFLKKSISCNPKDSVSQYCLGEIYYKTSALNEAKSMFSNAIAIDPGNQKAHYFLGLILKKQGDIEWAIKEFEIAQKSDDLKVKALTAKGLIYHELQEFGKAIGEFDQGLKFVRSGTESALNLRYYIADCYERTRDVASAIKHWEMINESNRNYKDVPDKLRQFGEFRQDDRIKDFMIANLQKFETICRRMIESMGCSIGEIYQVTDTTVDMIAAEMESNWRNARQTSKLVKIIRTTDPVHEQVLRKLLDDMKPKNASRAMIITAGEYASKAIDFANTRPIDLLGKTELIELLKKVM